MFLWYLGHNHETASMISYVRTKHTPMSIAETATCAGFHKQEFTLSANPHNCVPYDNSFVLFFQIQLMFI